MKRGTKTQILGKVNKYVEDNNRKGMLDIGKRHMEQLLKDLGSTAVCKLPPKAISTYWDILNRLTELYPVNAAGFVYNGGISLAFNYLADPQYNQETQISIYATLLHVASSHQEPFHSAQYLGELLRMLKSSSQVINYCTCLIAAWILYQGGLQWKSELVDCYQKLVNAMPNTITRWKIKYDMNFNCHSFAEKKRWLQAEHEPVLQYLAAWELCYHLTSDFQEYRAIVQQDVGLNVIRQVMEDLDNMPKTAALLKQVLTKCGCHVR